MQYEGERPYGGFRVENLDAHGGWLASAVDLARFVAALDDPNHHPALSAASIERMFALPENLAGKDYQLGDSYYACGWQVRDYGNGQRNTWHTGSLPGTYTFWPGGEAHRLCRAVQSEERTLRRSTGDGSGNTPNPAMWRGFVSVIGHDLERAGSGDVDRPFGTSQVNCWRWPEAILGRLKTIDPITVRRAGQHCRKATSMLLRFSWLPCGSLPEAQAKLSPWAMVTLLGRLALSPRGRMDCCTGRKSRLCHQLGRRLPDRS